MAENDSAARPELQPTIGKTLPHKLGSDVWVKRDPATFSPDASGSFIDLAMAARANGWISLVPLARGTKKCILKAWPRFATEPTDDDTIQHWFKQRRFGVGYVHAGHVVAIDLDLSDEGQINERLGWLCQNVRGTPMVRIGCPPRCMVFYRASPGVYDRRAGPEIFFDKPRMTVLFGRHPSTGGLYEWFFGSPANRRIDQLPRISKWHLDQFLLRYGADRQAGGAKGLINLIIRSAPEPLHSLEAMARMVANPGKFGRHPVCQAMIAYAFNQMHSVDGIRAALKPAYLAQFDGHEQREREDDFEELLKWTQVKGERGIGGVSIEGFQ